MNNEQTNTQINATANPKKAPVRERPVGRPERRKWVSFHHARLALLRMVIAILCIAVLLTGMMLLFLPAFKVRTVTVEGNAGIVSEDQIRNAAGVIGKEVIGLDLRAAEKRILEQCPTIRVRKITAKPSSVKITVEPRAVMYFSMQDAPGTLYFTLDRDFRVLAVSQSESDFSGLIKVQLPAIESFSIGNKLNFINGETDRAYIGEMLDLFGASEWNGRVSLLDVSMKNDVSFILDGKIQIIIGKVNDLNAKLELAAKMIEEKKEDSEYMVINVSDPKNGTYRPLSGPTFSTAG